MWNGKNGWQSENSSSLQLWNKTYKDGRGEENKMVFVVLVYDKPLKGAKTVAQNQIIMLSNGCDILVAIWL